LFQSKDLSLDGRDDALCGSLRSGAIHNQNRWEGIPMKIARVKAGLWLLGLLALLIPAGAALAQDDEAAAVAAMGGIAIVIILVALVFVAAAYCYFALALSTIARKTNTENAWWGWVPILQILLMLNVAKKPIWWIVLCLIPFVNIVIFIIVWMAIAEARGKPNWWGILIIVPVVSLIVPGYLAWAD
jgi:hypothetical protein